MSPISNNLLQDIIRLFLTYIYSFCLGNTRAHTTKGRVKCRAFRARCRDHGAFAHKDVREVQERFVEVHPWSIVNYEVQMNTDSP